MKKIVFLLLVLAGCNSKNIDTRSSLSRNGLRTAGSPEYNPQIRVDINLIKSLISDKL